MHMSNFDIRKSDVDYKTPTLSMNYKPASTPANTPRSISATSPSRVFVFDDEVIFTPPNTPKAVSLTSRQRTGRSFFDETTYSVKQTLEEHQYTSITKISKTLQGSIWQAFKNNKIYIIKVTNKLLHQKHITNYHGRQIHISENVIKEASIVKYLSTNPPKSLVKYIDFFHDKFNYMFVMQYGGDMSLFELVKQCHKYIEMGMITLEEWHKFCRIAMRQMVHLVDWLHTEMHCCHLDISLSNFVVDNVMVEENPETNTITIFPDFQVRIIDFGLAEVFYKKNKRNKIDFNCTKFVGKTLYKAPKVYEEKERFDARSADIWSLKVLFFIMLIGCPPYDKPSMNDVGFRLIMNGHLDEMLSSWGKLKTITPNIFSLLKLLFQNKNQKLTLQEIENHPFLLYKK